jgi:hypothetical protein
LVLRLKSKFLHVVMRLICPRCALVNRPHGGQLRIEETCSFWPRLEAGTGTAGQRFMLNSLSTLSVPLVPLSFQATPLINHSKSVSARVIASYDLSGGHKYRPRIHDPGISPMTSQEHYCSRESTRLSRRPLVTAPCRRVSHVESL